MKFTRSHGMQALVMAAFILLAMTGCTCLKHGAYDMAMGLERCGTGLRPATLTVDDMEIAIFEGRGKNEKPAMVLVHGFGSSKDVWLRCSKHLKDDFYLIAIDLPGHGESAKIMDRDYSMYSQVSYLRDIIAELSLERPHLAGNSMGGTLVTLYAARYPEDVASIILLNPAGISAHESEFMEQLARGENPLLVANTSDYMHVLDFTMEQKPFLLWPISSVLAQKAVSNRPIHEKIFADTRLKDSLLNGRKGFREILGNIRVPALLIWGRYDRLVNVENAAVFNALIPDSRLVILNGAGHVPMLENPKISAENMKAFALECSSR